MVPETQEHHNQIEAFTQAALRHPKALDLREQFRPGILEHLKQAHECLGLIIQGHELGSQIPGSAVYGYALQHEEHMKAAQELSRQLITQTIEILQEEAQ